MSWISKIFKTSKDKSDSVSFEQEIEDPNIPELNIKFTFIKKGIGYDLTREYSYNDAFIETLRSNYGINESNNQVAIDRFLMLGVRPMDGSIDIFG